MILFLSLQLHIEKLVYGGEGLSRLDGEVVFTPFVLPGETVEAERTEARKHVQRARLLRVEGPSPDRTARTALSIPICPASNSIFPTRRRVSTNMSRLNRSCASYAAC